MMQRTRLLIVLVLAALRGQSAEFSIGSIEQGATIEFTLPFATADLASVAGPVVTDCECLTPLEGSAANGTRLVGRCTFAYRSVRTGKIRVNVWMKSEKPEQVIRHTVTGFVYDRAWVVTAGDVKNESRNVIVDTRWAQQYSQVHIPRSLNIPAFAIASRPELRGLRIVLIDGGYASVEQFALAELLRENGFCDVAWLVGGIPAWLRSGGDYEGTAAEPIVAASTISPIEFARAQRSGTWTVVELPREPGSPADPDSAGLARLAVTLRDSRSAEGFPSSVLAVGEDTALHAKAERTVGRSETRGPYYLAGGAAALAAFRDEQRALADRPTELFQTQIASGRPLMGSGCASCPKR